MLHSTHTEWNMMLGAGHRGHRCVDITVSAWYSRMRSYMPLTGVNCTPCHVLPIPNAFVVFLYGPTHTI